MAEKDPQSPEPESSEHEEEPEYAPTPFDGPYVVPVLLLGMAVWFFYDGWFNPEIKSVAFNRWGSGVLAIAAVVTGFRAWREERQEPGS